MKPVFFATNEDRILVKSQALLRAIADALIATPYIRKLRIEGHTDDVGTIESNQSLSERRAASVVAALVGLGVEVPRLESVGFGKSRPLAQGQSARDRAMNRRVEFRIVDPMPTESDPSLKEKEITP